MKNSHLRTMMDGVSTYPRPSSRRMKRLGSDIISITAMQGTLGCGKKNECPVKVTFHSKSKNVICTRQGLTNVPAPYESPQYHFDDHEIVGWDPLHNFLVIEFAAPLLKFKPYFIWFLTSLYPLFGPLTCQTRSAFSTSHKDGGFSAIVYTPAQCNIAVIYESERLGALAIKDGSCRVGSLQSNLELLTKATMFSRLSAIFIYTISAFAVLAAANHKPATTTVTVTQSPSPTPVPASQCNTGPVQCCNSVQSADDPTVVALADDLGIAITGVDGLVGINCTPITVVGAGSGAQCNSQPVCCENNSFNGLIAIGCVIVNINA